MGKEVENNKFTWVIKNFCSLRSKKIYSDEFVVGGCIWRLVAFPKGNGVECLSLYLEVAGDESLPTGWRRQAKLRFSLVNQLSEELSETKEQTEHWFDAKVWDWGYTSMFPLNKLHDKDGGFVVNGKLKIVAEVHVVEVIGKLDVPDEFEEEIESLSNLEEDDSVESSDTLEEDDDAESNDFLEEASSVKETVEVNGFQVLPSQVESVSHIFERHPDIASQFRAKNQHLKSSYINVLLSLIEMMCQSAQELSMYDLTDAAAALDYLTGAGLNLDWLESKMGEVTEKKENAEAGETRMKEIEEELKDLKLKWSNLEAQLEKEKANVSVAKAPLSFDDIV